MKINNKTFKDWTAEDLNILINNDDFRESQTVDFKRTFEFLEAADKSQKAKAKNEFRNDVCSFANADGGDIIFGVSENNGVASKIIPISIANTDKFELDLRNALLPILPSMPAVEFGFISVDNGYVVVAHIEKGLFKPYMTIENETIFRFFVRHGNCKSTMSYSEISNDFLHAASLHSEVKKFRMERLSQILEDNTGMFGVIHVIPTSFTNPADFIPMCDLCRTGKLPFPIQLNNYIRGTMVPNVDGVWFPSDDGLRDFELLRLFNNGSVELKKNLYTQSLNNEQWLVSYEFIDAIGNIVEGTAEIYKSLGRKSTVYICISIIGCKGYRNYGNPAGLHRVSPKIDRDRILCDPIEIKDISDAENVQAMIEECKKMTRYALGMR